MATMNDIVLAANKAAKTQVAGMGISILDPIRIPTGIFALDLATGGGFPRGRCSLIYGLEAGMKTTISLLLIAAHQRMFPTEICAFFDIEGHLLQSWAEVFGVDWSKLVVFKPKSTEQVVNLVEGVLETEDVGLVVVDSLAAMVSQKELDADAETANVGTAGLALNKLYRKLTSALNEAEKNKRTPTVVLINQIRYKVGVMYGNPETLPGGPSQNFLSSLSLKVRGSDEFLKKTDKLPTYKKINGTITKNKVPILNKNVEFMVALRDIPELNIKLGGSYSWNTVLIYLKSLGLLTKVDDGWELAPLVGIKMVYPTQDALKERYQSDPDFAGKLRKALIAKVLTTGDLIEADE